MVVTVKRMPASPLGSWEYGLYRSKEYCALVIAEGETATLKERLVSLKAMDENQVRQCFDEKSILPKDCGHWNNY